MKKLNMKAYKVSSIEFKNNLEPNTKLELKNQYSHNVKYARNNICEGIFRGYSHFVNFSFLKLYLYYQSLRAKIASILKNRTFCGSPQKLRAFLLPFAVLH